MVKTSIQAIEVVLNHTCSLGEGPIWDGKRKAICWVDILNGDIHEFLVNNNQHRRTHLGNNLVGSIAFCQDGNFIAALQNGLAIVNRDSGEVKMLYNPEAHLLNRRFNGGKCDPVGRFWVGSMELSEKPGVGSLYMIDKDLSYSKKLEGLTIPNGLAWSKDYKTFYFIDTPNSEVAAYDYDLNTGQITNKRVVIKVSQEEGYPDGMTIDQEGRLWIAHWDGWQVACWDPKSGKKLFGIPLPVAHVSSCTFGGDDLQDLYITSAKIGLTKQQLEKQPLAGSLFIIRGCGSQGMDAFEFDFQTIKI